MIDPKTISEVIQGNSQAFEEVYIQTHDKAYSIAYHVLKDDYEAEDIVQDAYIKMIEQISQLQNPDKLESWFYRIVQNKALDHLRTSHADTFSSFENEESDFSFSDTLVSDYTPFDPEASVDYAETKRLMAEIVDGLPEMQRKCILLRFQKDMKIGDIAKELGIPESTVKSNLNYGKKKIEAEVKALEKQGVKLYSITPATIIPFLRWMWGASSASAAAALLGSSGVAAAAKAGFAFGAKQLIAAICAVAVIGGTAAAVIARSQPAAAEETLVETQPVPETTQPEIAIPETTEEETVPETTEEETIPETTEEETVPETTAPQKQPSDNTDPSGQTATQPIKDAESNTFMEPIDFGPPAPPPTEPVKDYESDIWCDDDPPATESTQPPAPPPAETVEDHVDNSWCD